LLVYLFVYFFIYLFVYLFRLDWKALLFI